MAREFDPATTLAFALRRDMHWVMADAYWIVQFAAAVCGSLLARGFFGPAKAQEAMAAEGTPLDRAAT
jgi:glycerol uptake facilitator-like aquaporin